MQCIMNYYLYSVYLNTGLTCYNFEVSLLKSKETRFYQARVRAIETIVINH
jgi:hypothetical protein